LLPYPTQEDSKTAYAHPHSGVDDQKHIVSQGVHRLETQLWRSRIGDMESVSLAMGDQNIAKAERTDQRIDP
jgi:hypothetical protein